MTSKMNATALKANPYPSAVSLANPAADSQPLCVRCGYSGSDVRILGCGCTFHAVSHRVYFVRLGIIGLRIVLTKNRHRDGGDKIGLCFKTRSNFMRERIYLTDQENVEFFLHACGKFVSNLIRLGEIFLLISLDVLVLYFIS